ncbi:hypothetical protein [Streptomyces profundus]|uniref:hypothetical protein n=1 Tax=Streptomyces profundus TaxID=2867410 RepID=UPI001D164604|nr:hypothetical protein [Streptomyces sp. MA3_2.13]UED86786.1 hypothetical protein K4G22_23430 [Streptomyces sp. MA3_2.13]
MSAAPEEPAKHSPARPAGRWWWGPALFGGALAALALAALSPWADAPFDELGSAPWWVAATALLAWLTLLGGLGARRGLRLAGTLAALTAALAVIGYLGGTVEADPPELFASATEPGRPVAALLAASAALVAAALCFLLSRRRVSWLPPAGTGDARARARRLTAATLAGVLLAGLAGVGGGYGAQSFQRGGEADSRVDATSQPVPPGERDTGVEVSYGEHHERVPHFEPTEVLWQETLPGAAALTTCLLDQPPYEDGEVPLEHDDDPLTVASTLVSVEAGDGEDAVIGYDTADGTERWRYTVRYEGAREDPELPAYPGRIGQVGVSDFCTVHVVADATTLVTLDGGSGEVLRETALPEPGHRFENPARSWMFLTGTHPYEGDDGGGFDWRPVVPLGQVWEFYLEQPNYLLEVRQRDGTVLSAEGLEDAGSCFRMIAPDLSPFSPRVARSPYLVTNGCVTPRYTKVPPLPQYQGDVTEAEAPHRSAPLTFDQVTALGCPYAPYLSEAGAIDRSLVLVGHWCREDFDGPVLLFDDSSDTVLVAELPADTELPLRPTATLVGEHPVAWLSGGSLYALTDVWGETVLADGPRRFVESAYREIHGGPEPLEAAFVGGAPAAAGHESLLVYGVTASGTVLALAQEADDEGEFAPELSPYAELPEAAGSCAGSREIVLDRAGLKLLTWCETPEGTVVTAVAGERLTEADDIRGQRSY